MPELSVFIGKKFEATYFGREILIMVKLFTLFLSDNSEKEIDIAPLLSLCYTVHKMLYTRKGIVYVRKKGYSKPLGRQNGAI